MSREQRLTEELGWLKVLFAALVAVVGSLISWLGRVNERWIFASAIGFIVVLLIGAGLVVRIIYKRLAELDQL